MKIDRSIARSVRLLADYAFWGFPRDEVFLQLPEPNAPYVRFTLS
jgi:hypothetical protein